MLVNAYYRIVDDYASLIRSVMRSRGLTQQQLAREAGISQATVSRALEQPTVRMGRARRALFNYIHKHQPAVPEVTASAIAQTWDGTDAHAKALAELILVSGKLRGRLGEE